jgi:hypothetical protein
MSITLHKSLEVRVTDQHNDPHCAIKGSQRDCNSCAELTLEGGK